jgi:HAD superfamily hydrolase (TIGR01459 family)
MLNVKSPLLIQGLSELYDQYDALFCDIWGVAHNGVRAYDAACEALVQFRSLGGQVILVSNSPRPRPNLMQQLDGFGVPRAAYDTTVSSGDVTRQMLAEHAGSAVLHIGPERDLPLFDGFNVTLVERDNDAELIVCTGLFDDTRESADDYRQRFSSLAERGVLFLCANPDLVVERGQQIIPCAGALAALYETMGGRVEQAGKPYLPIYEQARALLNLTDQSRILAIGDALRTDILGAQNAGVDALLIGAGIHAAQLLRAEGTSEVIATDALQQLLDEAGLSPVAAMPRLRW